MFWFFTDNTMKANRSILSLSTTIYTCFCAIRSCKIFSDLTQILTPKIIFNHYDYDVNSGIFFGIPTPQFTTANLFLVATYLHLPFTARELWVLPDPVRSKNFAFIGSGSNFNLGPNFDSASNPSICKLKMRCKILFPLVFNVSVSCSI